MPLGNGHSTALVFPLGYDTPFHPNGTDFELPSGVSFFVNMATAMASDTSLFRLGMVSLQTKPDIFSGRPASFLQKLETASATVTISTDIASVRVWVDANTDAVRAEVVGSSPLELTVRVQTVHPHAAFAYDGGFGLGDGTATSHPDEFRPDASAEAVVISHRNEDSDTPAAFNETLRQQGLSSLIDQLQGSDHWRHRQFGMRLSGRGLKLVNSTALTSKSPASHFSVLVSLHSNQTETAEVFHRQLAARHAAHHANGDGRVQHERWWQQFWDRSWIYVWGAPSLDVLNQQYALTRYVQAIQARDSHWVPIKFNGMHFTAQLPPETASSGPSSRDWGANSWWQNTRLPYGNTLATGDADVYANLLEFVLQMTALSEARTRLYFNHTGTFYTETKTLFGTYRPEDYGRDASWRNASTIPISLEENPYINFDFGGDGGTTEIAFMVLDHWQYTQDRQALRRYLPIVVGAIDFFRQHYKDRDSDGKMTIFPTQALETYWCDWKAPYKVPWPMPNKSNCISNDHPTVVSLHVLLEKALMLPREFVSAAQLAEWRQFQAILPEIPMIDEDGVLRVSPYLEYPKNSETHNSETPELYSTHPFRHFTLGRHRLGKRLDILPSILCMTNSSRRTCRNSDANTGWTQGVMNAALLGLTPIAKKMVLERAREKSAHGYRFPAFAQHYQDFEPSADHFANMNTALNWMILQPADDEAGSALLFGSWPCEWDVDFRLWAPLKTRVEGSLRGGTLRSLTVTPAHRMPDIYVMNCLPAEGEERVVYT